MEIPLPPNMGTLKTICHNGALPCEGKCDHPWEGRWRERGRQPRRRWPHKEKNLAIKVMTEAWDKKNMAAGRQSKPSGRVPTLQRYGIEVLSKLDTVSERTRHRYIRTFHYHAVPYLGSAQVTRVTFNHIKDMIAKMEKGTPDNPPVYPGTIDIIVNCILRAIFKQAQEDGWVNTDPTTGHKIKPAPPADRYVPTTGEIHRLAGVVKRFWRAAIYILAGTGIRTGELLGLTPDCIQGEYLYVYRQWQGISHGWGNLKHDRQGKGRLIPLDPIVMAEIRRHIDEFDIQPDMPLFRSPRDLSRPYSHDQLFKTFRDGAKALGLEHKNIRPHNLRHYFASMCVDRGIEIAEISRMLGHKSIELTYRTYYKMTKHIDRIQTAINGFLSIDAPETLVGANSLAPTDVAAEVKELMSRLELITGKSVVLESLDLTA